MSNPLADEARSMTDTELGEAINEAYREVFNLGFQKGTRQLQNPMAVRAARRQVARLRTILRERQLAIAAGTPLEPLARIADVEEDVEEAAVDEVVEEEDVESVEAENDSDESAEADSASEEE